MTNESRNSFFLQSKRGVPLWYYIQKITCTKSGQPVWVQPIRHKIYHTIQQPDPHKITPQSAPIHAITQLKFKQGKKKLRAMQQEKIKHMVPKELRGARSVIIIKKSLHCALATGSKRSLPSSIVPSIVAEHIREPSVSAPAPQDCHRDRGREMPLPSACTTNLE